MPSVIGEAAVRITPETRFFARDVGRELAGPLKGVFGKLGAVAAGAFAGVKFARFLGDSFREAQEARKVIGQVNAVIKSTGGIAKVSAKQVDTLANNLSSVAGVDDEVIARGEALLLTFTNVRNEVGKGNDIFNQATQAAVDLSAALGQDMQSSVIQLGKALNDPVRGVTALRRVGVSFTKAQEDQIKSLVKSNHLLDAQKIVLGELKKEFGGAAAALATPWDRMKVALKNVEEAVGNALLPTLDRFSKFAVNTLAPAITNKVLPFLKDLFHDIGDIVKAVGPVAIAAVKAFLDAFRGPEADQAKDNVKGIADDSIRLSDVLTAFSQDVAPTIIDVFSAMGEAIRTDFIPNVQLTIAILGGAATQAQHVVRDIIGAFEAFGRFLDGFIERFRLVFQGFGGILRGARDVVGSFVSGSIALASGLWKFLAGVFTLNIKAAFHGLSEAFSGLLHAITGVAGGVTRAAIGVVRSIVGVFAGIVSKVIGIGGDVAAGFVNGIISFLARQGHRILHALERLIPGPIRSFFGISSPSKLMFGIGQQIGQGLILGFESIGPIDPRLSVGTLELAAAGAGGVRGGPTFHQTFQTGQTDPRLLANELAFRMAREAER